MLDLGCSSGLLSTRVRRLGHEITASTCWRCRGVRDRVDRFIQADLDQGLPPEVADTDPYDVVLAADVLEHVREPEQLLAQLRDLLIPRGLLIASVPNFGHWYARGRVALGLFDYDQRGILDRGHVRFFTRRGIRRRLERAGFNVIRQEATGLPLDVLMDGGGGFRRLLRAIDRPRRHLRARRCSVTSSCSNARARSYRASSRARRVTEAAAALQPALRDRTTRLADTVRLGPAEWVWALTLGVQVLITGLLTSYTYFFVDDFLLLRQAQTSSFDLTYLRVPLFEHFSPVTRILNKVVVDIAPGSFGFAHALELVMYAAAIAAMMFVLRTIMGRTWGALALTLLFGQSIFLLRLLTWWTATANILPATVGMLLALGAYLRWWMRGGKGWLVLAFAAFLVALLDYETAMLFPVNLLLIRLLVLSDRLDPREWVRIVWRERAAWIGFGVLDIAALANYFHRYYSQMPHPTGGQVVHFLDIAFFETFIPGLFGIKQLPSSGTATAVATTIAFAAIVGVTLYFRPRAWRCLVVLLAAFLLTLLPTRAQPDQAVRGHDRRRAVLPPDGAVHVHRPRWVCDYPAVGWRTRERARALASDEPRRPAHPARRRRDRCLCGALPLLGRRAQGGRRATARYARLRGARQGRRTSTRGWAARC